MLNGLDLFSGIGGISLALQPWVRTVCYVEIDRYCQAVIQARIADGRLDDAPIWDDVRTFDPGPWRAGAGAVDIVTGGFPCQDISAAGCGAGLAGERSGLFFEIVRICRELRPRYVFLENVAAITAGGRGGWHVVGALAALGYDCRWGVLSAFDVGAPHLVNARSEQGGRGRFWILAHLLCEGLPVPEHAGESAPKEGTSASWAAALKHFRWPAEPDVGRVAHGVPARVDRIAGLGNSVVPACAREAFARLSGFGEGWR